MLVRAHVHVEFLTVVVNDEDTGALNETSCADGNKGTLAQGRLSHNMCPTTREGAVNGKLYRISRETKRIRY